MEAAFRSTVESLRLLPPFIPHVVTVMAVVFAFHTEDPDGVGDALTIILFPDPSPSAGWGGGAPNTEVGRDIGGGDLNLLRGHKSSDGKEKGCPHCRLGQGSIPNRGLGRLLQGVPER